MSIRSVEEVFLMLDMQKKETSANIAKDYHGGDVVDKAFLRGVEYAMKMLACVDQCDMGKLHEVVRQAGYVILVIVPWTLLSAIQ